MLDAVLLRHILLATFIAALAFDIAVLGETLFLYRPRNAVSHFRLLDQDFRCLFRMGVVSGVIMSFQFGTNWCRFSDAMADVLSSMIRAAQRRAPLHSSSDNG